jgi:hypothetical protein
VQTTLDQNAKQVDMECVFQVDFSISALNTGAAFIFAYFFQMNRWAFIS